MGSTLLILHVSINEAIRPQAFPPASWPANKALSCSEPLPVHSAHVGEEREIHYRWHPCFGLNVSVRWVEQRATGQFLKVEGPSGVVVSIPSWMVDPLIYVGQRIGLLIFVSD
jgi:hypothetical protein